MKEERFGSILVVGIGLIGGSILKSFKGINIQSSVYGYDIHEKITEEAFSKGLIKNPTNDIEVLEENSLVIFAVPSLALNEAFSLIQPKILNKNVMYSDTLSSKTEAISLLEKNRDLKKKFIMSHPITGSEKSGLSNSLTNLFNDRLVVLSSSNFFPEDREMLRIKNFWEELGSRVIFIDPEEHDKIFANTSHLPHVLAYALMNFLFKNLKENTFLFSGGSLEEYTRIASSDPVMWKDIMISNKKEILKAIQGFKESIDEIHNLIELEDTKSLKDLLSSIQENRNSLLKENS